MGKKRGFTLIELLVAMGIIAVLVTLSITAIGIVQRSLRNTQRRDIGNTMRLWILEYKNTNGTYPDTGDFSAGGGGITHDTEGLVVEATGAMTPLATQANKSESDGTRYCYRAYGSAGNRTNFSLGVAIEPGGSSGSPEYVEEFGDLASGQSGCNTGQAAYLID